LESYFGLLSHRQARNLGDLFGQSLINPFMSLRLPLALLDELLQIDRQLFDFHLLRQIQREKLSYVVDDAASDSQKSWIANTLDLDNGLTVASCAGWPSSILSDTEALHRSHL